MTPDFKVIADGEDFTATIKDRLIYLSVSDEAGYKSDAAEIKLDDRGAAVAIPANGATLTISMGYKDALVEMGSFVTDEVSSDGGNGGQTITIRAKAPDMEGTIKEQKTRAFDDKTIREIVTQIAGEHSLIAAISAAHADFKYKHLAQNDESDMSLLTRVARDHDAIAAIKDVRLVFASRGVGETVDGDAMPLHIMRKGAKSTWRATLTGRTKYKSVTAHWTDKKKAERVIVREGEGEPVYRLRHPFPNQEEAEKAVKAKFDELARGVDTLSLTGQGQPEIGAAARLQTEGFREGVDGLWSIKSANHKIDNAGFTTTIEAEQPTEVKSGGDGAGEAEA